MFLAFDTNLSITDLCQHLQFRSRALSLQNLVSGYGCGRVFPAGVGPGSPSRYAANWLPSRFGQSVETRRRQHGWLRMVFPDVRLFRAPIWWPSGGWRHARGREHCRGELGSSLSGGYAPDSAKARGSSIIATSQGRAEPLCTRIKGANQEVSEGKVDV